MVNLRLTKVKNPSILDHLNRWENVTDSDNSNYCDLNSGATESHQRVEASADSAASRRWYVIYTKPHSEDLAREQLESKGLAIFSPKIREVRFRRHKMREIIQPLFPSYIFARFAMPDEYYDVKWAKGVKRIVGSGDLPIPLDDSIVVFLREQTNEQGLVHPRPNLRIGDKIRVRQGPLEGLFGIIQGELDAKGRVKVLMDILHSGAKVELPFSYVERCDF